MEVETFTLKGNGRVPNSRFPVLIYREAFTSTPVEMEAMLRQNGWPPDWHTSYGLYPRHHFHSDTHELIAVSRGSLNGRFGGHDGVAATLNTGDIIVIPAGVGHFGETITEDLRLTGAFPVGFAIHDFRMGHPDEYARMVERSQRVPIPAFDPVCGASGPLIDIWQKAQGGVH